MDEAEFLCDRVAIIDKGKILVLDNVQKLKDAVGNDVITLNSTKNEKFIKILDKVDWIKNIEKHEPNLTMGVEKGEEKIPVLIELAQKNDIQVRSISVRKPTLDDVFLHYTGRSIRDSEKTQHGSQPRFQPRRHGH
jgi:ABC-2 type transport system ATP-binding protein